ncbi:PQQ-dependent sugar dehydrogenase [Pontixanthobacter aestiaquae]|uniref:PQQ-dependent sugar dehydrogenase n=2 Tax=Pontixanthobacter aestiaquae TaxID=1509367 RepID=A0A844Z2Z6_9SPHN|nr:PQQ-dependent sugar dehydrogenase [Pontixanthobacter aestiaquae]MDN3645936.1 PQQ-dependent sugar dehydrogenase [Pontixanthobacter aestiaquae]MXO83071.1 PQQ-dependent sugar dehydrogenase [Pontixanthobacter aestiaquae]
MISKKSFIAISLSPLALALTSCGAAASVDSAEQAPAVVATAEAESVGPFTITTHGEYNEPWAAAIEPGTGNVFITEKSGAIKFFQPANGKIGFVTGEPEVDYGGQGGLGDIAFAPDYQTSKMVYLSWAEAGDGDTRGAVVGRGTLACEDHDSCEIQGLTVIWRQAPKTTGRGHYGHRILFSPDGKLMYVASSDRQKMTPAQDNTNNIGTIVRLNLDGTPAKDNPMADKGGVTAEIWSYGHRNILGMDFDAEGRLWEVEHGPKGGDEFNLVKPGANYGWPVVSNGVHYDNDPIPDNDTRPDLAQSAITWTPVIAPGGMTFLSGDMFAEWKGTALIAGLSSNALIHIKVDGENATEAARYDFGTRLRGVLEAPDGAIWVIEDGEGGRLLRLTPAS